MVAVDACVEDAANDTDVAEVDVGDVVVAAFVALLVSFSAVADVDIVAIVVVVTFGMHINT